MQIFEEHNIYIYILRNIGMGNLSVVFQGGLRDSISIGCSALHAKILITTWEMKHI